MPTNAESAGSAHNAEVSVVENNGPAEAATLPIENEPDPEAVDDPVGKSQLPGDQVVRQPTADQEGEIVATRDDDDE